MNQRRKVRCIMNDKRLDNLDAMMDKYVYGLFDGRQTGRILRKIEEDPEWQLAYEEAVDRKRLLTGTVRPSETSGAPAAQTAAAKAIAAAKGIYGARLRRRHILRWCSGVSAAAAAIVIGFM